METTYTYELSAHDIYTLCGSVALQIKILNDYARQASKQIDDPQLQSDIVSEIQTRHAQLIEFRDKLSQANADLAAVFDD